nr:upstream activation factor subunit UAF30-like [Ipomoea batatas]
MTTAAYVIRRCPVLPRETERGGETGTALHGKRRGCPPSSPLLRCLAAAGGGEGSRCSVFSFAPPMNAESEMTGTEVRELAIVTLLVHVDGDATADLCPRRCTACQEDGERSSVKPRRCLHRPAFLLTTLCLRCLMPLHYRNDHRCLRDPSLPGVAARNREGGRDWNRRCMENVEEERAPSRLSAIFAAAGGGEGSRCSVFSFAPPMNAESEMTGTEVRELAIVTSMVHVDGDATADLRPRRYTACQEARIFGKGCRILMTAAKSSAASSSGATTAPKGRGRPNGILKPIKVSPALEKFLGAPEASRTDAVKKVWEYIKAHNLQNPANKKEINCDEKLKTIFSGKDKVGFLEIAKLLTQHFPKAT